MASERFANVRICIDKTPEEALPDSKGIFQPELRWMLPIVPVSFLDGDPQLRAHVQEVARQWEDVANIHFNFLEKPEDGLVRISFREPGNWCYVGIDCQRHPEGPTMSLGDVALERNPAETDRIILHEFGHALGLLHENQNPNAEPRWNDAALIEYYAARLGMDSDMIQSQIHVAALDMTQFDQFDPRSIMLYPIPRALAKNGQDTEWNSQLSDGDKAFIATMYPFP